MNPAVGSSAVHYLADLLLLTCRKIVVLHRERLEGGLSSEEHEQWCHASIPVIIKPLTLSRDGEMVERVDRVVSERLQELVPIFCTAD